jgi:hypothetical protein
MTTKIKDMNKNEFQNLIADTVKQTIENIIEDYTALNSDSFIASISKARDEYKKEKTVNFEEAFDV